MNNEDEQFTFEFDSILNGRLRAMTLYPKRYGPIHKDQKPGIGHPIINRGRPE